MATLRIYDIKGHVLALDLSDLLRLLAPRSLKAIWTVLPVKSSSPGHEWFEATGEGGEKLELLSRKATRLSGSDLAALAENTLQVIWGEFVGSPPSNPDKTWVVIRAADSTFFEIETEDDAILNKIRSAYQDIRTGETPIASWPMRRAE